MSKIKGLLEEEKQFTEQEMAVGESEGYKFDEKKHAHTLDGKPLMGVTTVLSVISKPSLIQWSANMACDYVDSRSMEFFNNPTLFKDILKEARTAHRKKKEKAGDWGTKVHEAVEDWIKRGVEPVGLDEMGVRAFENFKKWAEDNNVKFIESEKHLYSREMWIGGIVDLVFEMDGKKYIGDIKTSSGIYNEAFFQMGAYHLMLEEMGEKDVAGYIVINLKKDGTMDMKRADNMKINQDAFKHALGLYKIINVMLEKTYPSKPAKKVINV